MTALIIVALALLQSLILGSWLYGLSAILRGRFGSLSFAFALAAVGLVGYAAFWICYALPEARPWLQALVIATGGGLTAFAGSRGARDKDAAICVLLLAVSLTILLLWVYAPVGFDGMLMRARSAWTSWQLDFDNFMPFFFARDILIGEISSPLIGDWLSSDRPPLQTGLFLAFALPWFGDYADLGEFQIGFQFLGSALQLLAVPSAYYLARALELSRWKATVAATVTFFMPITLINGIFVWPKLVGAAFLLAATAIHFTVHYAEAKASWLSGLVFGALCGFAMLCHGTSAFTILGFGFAALVLGRWGTWPYAVAALLAAVLLYAPWMAYQRYADPPGDRLIKWHLAGVITHDDPRSPVETIRDAYGGMSARQFLDRQVHKIKTSLQRPFAIYDLWLARHEVRRDAYYHPLPAMGFLGFFAVLLVPLLLFVARLRPLTVAVLAGYMSWIVMLFGTAATIVHQGSYFLWLVLPILAVALLARWPRVLAGAAAAQVSLTLYHFAGA